MQNAQQVYLETIDALIDENELEKAIDAMQELEKQTNTGLKSDLSAQSGRLKDLEKFFQRGMLPFDQYTIQKNAIRYALAEINKEFPKKIALNSRLQGLGSYSFEVPETARLEKIIGKQNNLLRINWLEKALQASRAVCRVVCQDGELGTGFLTNGGYVFTNNHVIPNAEVAKTARVEFNFETDINGKVKSRTSYKLDSTDFITSPHTEFDFARIKVVDDPKQPLKQWGVVEIDPTALPTVGEGVTIIQHPKGEDKQIALNANEVLSVWNHYLFYETDTEPGSSGSPVFNSDWKVVAIHHAGKTQAEGGIQINAKGDRKGANRGILFEYIFDFIERNKGKQPTPKPSGKGTGQESFTENVTPVDSPTTPPPTVAPKTGPKFWVVLYAIEDEAHAALLGKQLAILKFTKKIKVFNIHSDAQAGQSDEEVAAVLDQADMVLTLVTPNLFGSDFWFGKLLEAIEAKRTVVPILVERTHFDGTGLEKLKSLPSQNRFISDFPNANTAWADVVEQLKKAI